MEGVGITMRLAIIQKHIPHYRIDFFTQLQAQALDAGMEVTLYCAKGPDSRIPGHFRYEVFPMHYIGSPKKGAYWLKGIARALKGAGAIIAPLELQCLNIPYLWARRRSICKCWIWWGHGYRPEPLRRTDRGILFKEALKRLMVPRSAGLITYTEGGAEYWRKRGLPSDRVIPFLNTLDIERLRKSADSSAREDSLSIKKQLGLDGKRILLFSGRLYPKKKVDFLLRAIALLQKEQPDVALLILGDGPERKSLERLSAEMKLQSVYFLGEIVEPERTSPYFLMSELLVIPGLVGLAIIHGFTFGLPLVTTRHDLHSPEIEYLSDENGVMTEHEESVYAKELGRLLSSPARLQSMRQEARSKADELFLPRSVERFINGVRLFSGTASSK